MPKLSSNSFVHFFLFNLAAIYVLSLSACSHQSAVKSSSASTILLANQVADWQLAHMSDFNYVRTFQDHTNENRGWVQAAFYIGLDRWAHTNGTAKQRQALVDKIKRNDAQLGEKAWHGDDQAIGFIYAQQSLRTKDLSTLLPTRNAFDHILNQRAHNSLEYIPDPTHQAEATCQKRWCWCDALFMAPPVWAAVGKATGEAKYFDYVDEEYSAAVDYLFDTQENLFFRDGRFLERRSPQGNKIFWSRGNGWVFAGLALLLEQMTQDDPRRAKYETLFIKMASSLVKLQGDHGFWPVSLLEGAHYPLAETSGTGFITFGLAWGVNHSLLKESDYRASINKGWQALSSSVDNTGKLGWVQQVGFAPDQVYPDDTQLYGVGAFLLAASEIVTF